MTAIPKPTDDFDAARMLVEVLKDLQPEEQARAIRWAQERLGIAAPVSPRPPPDEPGSPTPSGATDIRSFVQTKSPSTDTQFATTVAYYYAFEAPQGTKKGEIGTDDLQEGARQANYPRLKQPVVTLNNAVKRGYLDRGSGRGLFKINTVGENLVAMSLPLGVGATPAARPVRAAAARKK